MSLQKPTEEAPGKAETSPSNPSSEREVMYRKINCLVRKVLILKRKLKKQTLPTQAAELWFRTFLEEFR
jgi:hypothetical protein